MDSDVASVLNGTLAANANSTHARTNIIGENLIQGLGTVQNLGIQYTNAAAVSASLMADDAQAAMGLNTAAGVPKS